MLSHLHQFPAQLKACLPPQRHNKHQCVRPCHCTTDPVPRLPHPPSTPTQQSPCLDTGISRYLLPTSHTAHALAPAPNTVALLTCCLALTLHAHRAQFNCINTFLSLESNGCTQHFLRRKCSCIHEHQQLLHPCSSSDAINSHHASRHDQPAGWCTACCQ